MRRSCFCAFFLIRKAQGISYLLGSVHLDELVTIGFCVPLLDVLSFLDSRFVGRTAHREIELCSLSEPFRARAETLLAVILDSLEKLNPSNY